MKPHSIFVLSVCYLAFTAADTALRVKWGVPIVDKEFYIEIPRTASEIEAQGWKVTARPSGGHLPSLVMYCLPDDVTFCPMYDGDGYIAGLQIAFPKADFTETASDLADLGFGTWTVDSVDYWVNQQYFVTEEQLASTGADKSATLWGGSVWVPNFDGTLLNISRAEAEMTANTAFKRQSCIPTMGRHYFYDMTSSLKCDHLLPWFTLTRSRRLVAGGLVVVGKLAQDSSKRDWFEHPSRAAVKVISPSGPDCLYDLAASPGLLTMHIYYDVNPWTITCI